MKQVIYRFRGTITVNDFLMFSICELRDNKFKTDNSFFYRN